MLSKLEGIWIDGHNTLMYALATRITFICPMKFNAFPMDIQICKFQVGKEGDHGKVQLIGETSIPMFTPHWRAGCFLLSSVWGRKGVISVKGGRVSLHSGLFCLSPSLTPPRPSWPLWLGAEHGGEEEGEVLCT